jgi:hypothetical protein
VLPSKSAPTTGRGSGKRKRGVDKEIEDGNLNGPSQGSEHDTVDTPIDDAVVQAGEDMHVNGLGSNAPQEKRSKKEVYSL